MLCKYYNDGQVHFPLASIVENGMMMGLFNFMSSSMQGIKDFLFELVLKLESKDKLLSKY